MIHKLTRDVKKQATYFMLDTSKQLILSNFDENDKQNKTINIENDTSIIQIRRNCSTDSSKPYVEDYRVYFKTILQNQKLESTFYLEWKNNDITSKELVPANTVYNPTTRKFSKRKITIRKCIE